MSSENFWDREVAVPTHTSWMEHPTVREYIARSISRAEEGLWPVDWFMQWLGGRRFARGLSIGCGTGALERDVLRKNLVDRIDAFDGSTNSLRIARDLARGEEMSSRARYFAADFNEPFLPCRAYDVVFIHQALHHVAKLEKLLRSVLLALEPGGVLYLDEYIGPSRRDWNDQLIAPQRAMFGKLPGVARRIDALPLPIQVDDPSEAIRSSEIMEQLEIGFDVREVRGYGGNLLSVLYPAVDFDRAQGAIDAVIEEEKRLLASGLSPFYAVIVATPKRRLRKMLASWRYFAEPKLKRIAREIAGRMSSPVPGPGA
jgi:SAM-dependent methyltransferase